jgi:Pectate lyase superfamily protein
MNTSKHTANVTGTQALNYLRSTLPAGSSATKGTLAYVTDDIRGFWFDDGISYIPLLGSSVNVREHGAMGDLRSVTDAVTSSTTTITSATAAFISADVGKNVYIAAPDGSGRFYGRCVACVNSTTVTVNTAVSFTAIGCTLWIATDDKPAFQKAVNSIGATSEKGSVLIPAGKYFLSGPILIKNKSNILVYGQGAASIIHFSSDNDALPLDADLVSKEMAQSAFVVKDSDNFTAQHLAFVGGYHRNLMMQLGTCFYFMSAAHPTVAFCHLTYGASLARQDNNLDDVGARILFNRSYGARRNLSIGDDSLILGNYFELPTTADYDRIGNNGSSHAIYQFAGRERVSVVGNHFKNIRADAVKFSGTSLAVRSCLVQGNVFDGCGCGVEYGDDTSNEITRDHSELICIGNEFRNCGNNRTGWRGGSSINIVGCKSAIINNNAFFYNRDAADTDGDKIPNPGGVSAISVARYSVSNAVPVESIQICYNTFTGLVGKGAASSALNILTVVIDVENVGQGLGQESSYTTGLSSVHIEGNAIRSVGAVGIIGIKNIGLMITRNVFNAIVTAVSLGGNRIPVICNNLLIPGGGVTSNDIAQLRFNKDSFPIFYDNYTQQRGNYEGLLIRAWTVSTNGSATPSDIWPVPGKRGLLVPTLGKPEVLIGFGDGWAEGDKIMVVTDVGTATFTYKASVTDSTTQFNTSANLITAINTNATISGSYEAGDYGDPWNIQTHHVKIRRKIATPTANVFHVTRSAASLTAGVVLPNEPSMPANNLRCYSRGEQLRDGTNRQVVLWSPLASPHSVPHVIGARPSSAAYLASGYYRGSSDIGSSIQIIFVNSGNPATADQFEFLLGN